MSTLNLKRTPQRSKRKSALKSKSTQVVTKISSESEQSDDEAVPGDTEKMFTQSHSHFDMLTDDEPKPKKMKKEVRKGHLKIGTVHQNTTGTVNPIETYYEKTVSTGVIFCHVCLSSNATVHAVTDSLRDTYRALLRDARDVGDVELCALCRRVLHNAHEFSKRCLLADRAVKELCAFGELTETVIEKTKIENNIPSLNLTVTLHQADNYNKEYVFLEPSTTIHEDNQIDFIKEEVPLTPVNEDFDDHFEDPIELDNNDEPLSKLKRNYTDKIKIVKAKKVKKSKTVNDDNKVATNKRRKVKEKTRTEVQKKMDEYFDVTIFKTIEEKINELQKRKSNSSYMNAPLKCDFCYQGYLDNETYDLHMTKHTDNYGGFTCEVCQYRCPSKERLRQHLYFRHSRKYNCKVCRFESHDKYRATLHMKFHEGKTYKCQNCDKVFNHLVNLHNHMRAKHPSDNVCDLCGYSFIGERGLKTHRSLTHGHDLRADNYIIPEDAPSCVECDVRFISEDALQMHLKVSPKHGKSIENFKKRNYHQLHRSIKCDDTDPMKEKEIKSITRKRDGIRLEKRGIRLTKFDEPVPCEKCGKEIASASEYHYHFKRSHPKEHRTWYPTDTHPHLCDICGKMLRMNALKDHMLEHEAGVSFACGTCGKRFAKRFNMRLHARAHLGERYPCTVCGKLFNHMGNRDRHVRYVHTESKDFKCEFCGKCFKNDGARRLHTDHVHLRKPYPKRNRNKEGQGDVKKRQKQSDVDPTLDRDIWE